VTPERGRLVYAVFDAAIRCDPAARPALLDRHCAGDAELRDVVEGLLAQDERASRDHFLAIREAPDGELGDDPLLFHRLRDLEPLLDTDAGAGPAPSSATAASGWLGADYEILGELGCGGMGIVYRAFDRRRREAVALKTVHRLGPTALERFKREFRALAGVVHPNLVTLHELVSDGSGWFFTMELVEGLDFLAHVRPGGALDPDRLRDAARQLADGLAALHAAGRLHRDLKPSNVRVTPSRRVVILDFGLAAELDADGWHKSTESQVLGTVAYMAPEQAAGGPVGPGADWYSLGVMLYQAMTGRVPFDGGPLLVLEAKRRAGLPTLPERWPDEAEDLGALCVELLRRDPAIRPGGAEVLRRLGNDPGRPAGPQAPAWEARRAAPLVGREQHLESLEAALAVVRGGRPLTILIGGCSGVGKTTLVRRFLDDLARRDSAAILAGRCYEQESVPYKALDGLIDALGRYLRRLPGPVMRELMPRDVLSLARVFPVLRRVEAVAQASGRAGEVPNPQELRRRAFAAVRELLARLGDRQPLVLFIDDLQWGDVDSARLLAEVLRPPDPPVLLLLGTYRREDAETSQFLQMFARSAGAESGVDRRDLEVEPLTLAEARELALDLIGHPAADASACAEAVARESQGSPFFVHELVRHVRVGADPGDRLFAAEGISLDGILRDRVARLPGPARRLLEVVAVSGHPLEQELAFRTALLGENGRAALAALRSERFARGTGPDERDQIDVYHDRVREAVLAHLDPDSTKAHHHRLARELSASGRTDPEILALHHRGAGEDAEAGAHYARAGAQAAEALAFDRAAEMYRLALQLHRAEGAEQRRLRVQRGDALADAGRGAEAAAEYLAAAEGSRPAEAREVRRRAAMQLLISGHIDAGLDVLRDVLRDLGVGFPGTPRRALASLMLQQARLLLRGLRFRSREADEVPADDLARIEICWSAAVGLSTIDVIRGADFQARALLLSLRAGETSRITRSLIIGAAHASSRAGSGRWWPTRLFLAAERMARRADDPYADGVLCLSKGVVAHLERRYPAARKLLDEAEVRLRNRYPGAVWEIDTTRIYALWVLADQGEVAELRRRRSTALRDARQRGDLYLEAHLSTHIMAIVRLGADEVDEADEELRSITSAWSQRGFHLQHTLALVARVMFDLYRGAGDRAWDTLRRQWPLYQSSLLTRIQYNRVDMLQLRGRCAIAMALVADDPRPYLRGAAADARRLRCERSPFAAAMAAVIEGGVAGVRGQAEVARDRLAEATDLLEQIHMKLWASATRRRLGEWLGGNEGKSLINQANTWMVGQCIRDPARMTAMLIPGPC
jgi:hypothetical protein